jgi:N-acetylglucosamine kinase-like BadF-type ATPase
MVSDVKAQVGQVTRAHHVEVVADYVAAFVAALDDELGVVIVAGSGSVAYGVGPNGGPVRAGGAGYLFGDEGSAFDVGRRGIIAAVKAADGRGPNSILAEEVLTYFEVSDLREVLRLIYTRPLDRPTIAAFAQVVTRGAREGDDAAMEIIRGAAQDQCELALAVLQRTFPRDVVAPVRMIGGLVESGEIILEQVRAMLLSRWPSAEVACSPFRTEVGSLKIAFTTSGLPIPDRLRATP